MGFAWGGLGLGTLLFALVALFTREASWVFGLNLALAAFALYEAFGAHRKGSARVVGALLMLSAFAILVLRDPWVLALGNFLLGSAFFFAAAKFHHAHPEIYGERDFLGRQWARVAMRRKERGRFSEVGAPPETQRRVTLE